MTALKEHTNSIQAETRRWRPYVETFIKAYHLGLRLSGLPDLPETQTAGRPAKISNDRKLKVDNLRPAPR